jgi:tRNA (guanosine-2'-O-)-methyltransferase
MTFDQKQDLINYLEGFISENRKELFYQILDKRTRHLAVLIEDLYQPHNASAVLRSCDCFGVQDIHIIENRNTFAPTPQIDMGASKWLSTTLYNKQENNTLPTIEELKSKGYRIVATTPHAKDQMLDDFDITKGPFVLMFGTELEGLSDIAIENADEFIKIPMYGFTESFNISVSAAMCLHHLTEKLRKTDIDISIPDEEKLDIHISWLMSAIKSSDIIVEKYKTKRGL